MAHKHLALGIFMGLLAGCLSLCFLPCDDRDCAPTSHCKYGITLDDCGCCDVCELISGEECGGPFNAAGICGGGLLCHKNTSTDPDNSFGICIQDTGFDLDDVIIENDFDGFMD